MLQRKTLSGGDLQSCRATPLCAAAEGPEGDALGFEQPSQADKQRPQDSGVISYLNDGCRGDASLRQQYPPAPHLADIPRHMKQTAQLPPPPPSESEIGSRTKTNNKGNKMRRIRLKTRGKFDVGKNHFHKIGNFDLNVG